MRFLSMQAITGFVLPAQTFSTACVLHDGSAPASPDAPSVRASPDAPTGEPGKPNNLDFNGSVLVKVGDGKDSLFKHQDLMPMDRMTLVVTMSESKAFRVKLKDVPLDDCPVLVTASTKDEPTAAEWKAAVELKGAKTLRGCIKELEASGLLPAGASVFIHLLLPAAASDGECLRVYEHCAWLPGLKFHPHSLVFYEVTVTISRFFPFGALQASPLCFWSRATTMPVTWCSSTWRSPSVMPLS